MKIINISFPLYILISSCFAGNSFIGYYVLNWASRNASSVVENYLKKSAQRPASNAYAAYLLGTLYLEDNILQKDLWKARYYLTLAANLGSPEAMNSLGDGFYSGDIFERNTNCALYYYLRAARCGFGPAQFNAGIVLLQTAKNRRDLRRAVFYLDKASKNRDDLGDITKHAIKFLKDAQEKLNHFK
ncbi:MAG: sel1 repeat family protein [Holosporales bacterium]|jgi:TPR repeat protein|nr:sel1 repeat family protein [Holosporales bacterium]